MINELIKLADFLDSRGLCKEADYLDDMLKKHAGMSDDDIGYWLSDAGRLHGGAEVEPFIANLRTSFGLLAAANTDSTGGVANA